MPGPIADLAKRYMRDPQRITVKSEHMTVPQVRQIYYEVGGRDKFEVLARVLDFEMPSSAIIFCRTKSEVDSLGERLMARAFPAETLHGDLSQIQRDRVMGASAPARSSCWWRPMWRRAAWISSRSRM